MNPTQRPWLALWTLIGYAPAAFNRLRQLPLAQAVEAAALRRSGLSPRVCAKVVSALDGRCAEEQLEAITTSTLANLHEDEFILPIHAVPGLPGCNHPPPWIWGRGDADLLTAPLGTKACVVGSRRVDPAGLRMARQTARGLTELRCIVVSGGAIGVDAMAHKATLEAGGRTIAVLPSGLRHMYPRTNRRLFHAIVAGGGTLCSGFAPDAKPSRWHFPRRNEIMAGVCAHTIVVRAAPSSGSLITARAARRIGRRVLAIPADGGRPEFAGTNQLLSEGAEIVLHPDSPPIEGLRKTDAHPPPTPRRSRHSLTMLQSQILKALKSGPKHAEVLACEVGVRTHALHADILTLELAGLIVREPGSIYALTSSGLQV